MRKDGRGKRCQALVWLHQIEIDIRVNFKQIQHLIEHLPVLSCDTNVRFDLLALAARRFTTGAIFTASGRVPKMERTRLSGS
jgi:hypothetical protein